MYVDESGDPGNYISEPGRINSRHFILSGLILPISDWNRCLERLKNLRAALREQFGLLVRTEVHSVELIRIHRMTAYSKIRKTQRLKLLETYISALPNIFSTGKIINICYDKQKISHEGFIDYSDKAWNRLLQRYDTFLKHENAQGIVIPDTTNEMQIAKLLRKMRVFNPIPSHFGGSYQRLTDSIVEDPFLRESSQSYFIQSVDVIAHCLYRKEFQKTSLRKYNVHKYFNYLEPILLKQASLEDECGIVRK